MKLFPFPAHRRVETKDPQTGSTAKIHIGAQPGSENAPAKNISGAAHAHTAVCLQAVGLYPLRQKHSANCKLIIMAKCVKDPAEAWMFNDHSE